MSDTMIHTKYTFGNKMSHILQKIQYFFRNIRKEKEEKITHPFRVIVQKEISDHVRSWRFIILITIIILTCIGSVYTAFTSLETAVREGNLEGSFFFLKIFTLSDGSLPSFIVFISFLGPLLGISLGFDAINSEHNRGTLSRILAHPIHRDYLINAKFTAAIILISVLLFALSFSVLGAGLLFIGIPPTPEEFIRIILFTLTGVIYIAFWLNLSIFFSVRFKQSATSALAGIAVWLFFAVFYPLIINLVAKSLQPSEFASGRYIYFYEKLLFSLRQLMPNQVFNEATGALLTPSVRSLGPLTMEQVQGTIPGALPLGQSVLLIWPQITGLIAITVICFVLSYVSFMRREIRSR